MSRPQQQERMGEGKVRNKLYTHTHTHTHTHTQREPGPSAAQWLVCNFATLIFALQHADNTLYNRALDLADHWDASGEKETVHFISPLPQTPITPKARRRKKSVPYCTCENLLSVSERIGNSVVCGVMRIVSSMRISEFKNNKENSRFSTSPWLSLTLLCPCERASVCVRERCAAPRMDRNHTAAWRRREKMKARKPWSVKSALFVNSHTLTAPWRCAQKHGQTV